MELIVLVSGVNFQKRNPINSGCLPNTRMHAYVAAAVQEVQALAAAWVRGTWIRVVHAYRVPADPSSPGNAPDAPKAIEYSYDGLFAVVSCGGWCAAQPPSPAPPPSFSGQEAGR